MKKNICTPVLLLIFLTMLIARLPAFGQIDENYTENLNRAFAASTTEECQSSLKFSTEVLKVIPNHPIINYLAARLNAQLGHIDIALEYLKKATMLGYTTKLPFNKIHHLNDSAFSKIRGEIEFEEIIKALEEAEGSINKSQIAFSIIDKEFFAEGITYDPLEKMFYLGSTSKYKIIKVDHLGKSMDFTSEEQDGLGIVYGIHIDPIRRILWACSRGKNRNKAEKAEIFKYHLSSGKLIKKYTLPFDGTDHILNDLVIHPDGDVYITDTKGSAIYMISNSSDKLELFLKNKLFVGLNGITLSEDGKTIYVADYSLGIYKIDIKTKSFSLLSHEPDFSPLGIDGLYYDENELYAVQIGLNQISRFSMNEDVTHIEACEKFERYTPNLNLPTTGVIVDDYFYYITNHGGEGDRLRGVTIMKTFLK